MAQVTGKRLAEVEGEVKGSLQVLDWPSDLLMNLDAMHGGVDNGIG